MGTVTAVGARLIDWVAQEEGFRATPYRCPAGFLTVGYGLNLDAGITRDEAAAILTMRLETVTDALALYLPWWGRLDEVRRGVLVGMAYQMGVAGLLKFRWTLAMVERGDYEAAAGGMLASAWAQQTPGRAQRSAAAMRSGRWPADGN
jgi:lysozyme